MCHALEPITAGQWIVSKVAGHTLPQLLLNKFLARLPVILAQMALIKNAELANRGILVMLNVGASIGNCR